ncbi:MAG: hypothetical protein ACK5NU_03325 [Fusobacterium ulcerans]|uniref:hypothetical protein n=1 Tax=Fusobacterium ulcerans TaxID=861 RepID=UPI003A89BB9C
MNYSKIKQVYETKDVEEVNKLLKNEWILLNIYTKDGIVYVLGYVEDKKVKDIETNFNSFEDLRAYKKSIENIKKIEKEVLVKTSQKIHIGNGIIVEIL